MDASLTQRAIENYRSLQPVYEGFSRKLESLLRELLDFQQIKYQVIESRVKSVKSFEEKINRPGKRYDDPLNEITDLCGCRIILYYQDEVKVVSSMIKEEFYVREENLERQPELMDIDRFGYISAHYLISISNSRSSLIEWNPYTTLLAEIQIRTVIQHAWSAVSHALQYKQEAAVPSKIQRRLHRIAGLFELADEEFIAIRDERKTRQKIAAEEIDSGIVDVKISPISIEEFLRAWSGSGKLINEGLTAGFLLSDDESTKSYLIYDLSTLCGLNNIKDLQSSLSKDRTEFFSRLIELNKDSDSSEWHASLWFFVALSLIEDAKDRIEPEFLIARGFHVNIAKTILKALQPLS